MQVGRGIYKTTYLYVGAKSQVQGRGFLGFRQMTVRDEQTAIEQTTTYKQDFPFTGVATSQVKAETGAGAVQLNDVENTYTSTSLGGTRSFVHLDQSVQTSKDLDGTTMPASRTSYSYDSYGNATSVTVETGSVSGATFTGDGHSMVTTNTYTNDATNWLLGRLTAASVASTVP